MTPPHVTILPLESVDSTNTYAKLHFSELADAVLITAETQSSGRGRLNRRWISPAGNIYASFVMKRIDRPFYATMAASLSVLETLRAFAPEHRFFLKWPNDVYCGISKISGILSECVCTVNPRALGIIAGMGVNVNLTRSELDGLDQSATSLRCLSGIDFPVKKLIDRLAKSLEQCYISYLTEPSELFDRWRRENSLIGRILEFETPQGERFQALFRDVLESGEAVLEKDGETMLFSCGDVRVRKESISFGV